MSEAETYTPGYTPTASDLMSRRTLDSHASFLRPHLRANSRVLDCGCGPGSITCDIAQIVSDGTVTGIDREKSQLDLARNRASDLNLRNIEFREASIHGLPFKDSSFDVVFAHAIFEHISGHSEVLADIRRVLAPGGVLAIRSPDWGGFLVVPELPGVDAAIQAYADQQTSNGGDIHIGRKLPTLLRAAGFEELCFSAVYDCTLAASIVADYFALAIPQEDGDSMRRWGQHQDAVFAQCWCEIIGKRPAEQSVAPNA